MGANQVTWVKPVNAATLNWEIIADGHLLAKIKAGCIFDLDSVTTGVSLKEQNHSVVYGIATDSG